MSDENDTVAYEPNEYQSYTLVIDHLITEPQAGGAFNAKIIYSTQDATEAVIAQINYFSATDRGLNLLADRDTLRTIMEGDAKDVIYVYTPNDQQTQVIMDWSVGGLLKAHRDINPEATELGLTEALVNIARTAIKTAKDEGRPTELVIYVPHFQ